jgi:hypothetical protein
MIDKTKSEIKCVSLFACIYLCWIKQKGWTPLHVASFHGHEAVRDAPTTAALS